MPNKTRLMSNKGIWFCLIFICILAWPMQVNAWQPIVDRYFGATLFIVPTGKVVWPPVAVNSLAEYETTYGLVSGPDTDHGYQAARLFFANGGLTLYVIDPEGTQAQDFADALSVSVDLQVDIVAIPGAACCSEQLTQHAAIMSALSQHVEASSNRFGLIDAPLGSDLNALLAYRTVFNSEHSAIYAPWLELEGPVPGTNVTVPASSAVAGVISRIDRQHGIHKAPAGPDADLKIPPVVDVAREFSSTDRDSLQTANINPLGKFVSPLIVHVWGARTTRDVNVRQYVNSARLLRHLEFSMVDSLTSGFNKPSEFTDIATVEALIGDYMNGYWQQGALQGSKADEAYFVNCNIALPHMNCQVGVSALKPAEFEIIQFAIEYAEVIFDSGFEADSN